MNGYELIAVIQAYAEENGVSFEVALAMLQRMCEEDCEAWV